MFHHTRGKVGTGAGRKGVGRGGGVSTVSMFRRVERPLRQTRSTEVKKAGFMLVKLVGLVFLALKIILLSKMIAVS